MNMPSEVHEKLIEKFQKIFSKEYDKCIIGNVTKGVDLILMKDNTIVGLVECVITQGLSDAKKKLLSCELKGIRRIIARYKLKRNPKARCVIKQIEKEGIELIEIESIF